jgi:hypothetical protein
LEEAMTGRGLMAAVAVGVIAPSIFIADPASAHSDDSRLTLDAADHRIKDVRNFFFFGKVHNQHPGCKADETILLKRVRKGIVRTVRTTVTNSRGEYSFRFDPTRERGKWFTRYRGRVDCGYKNRHSCDADVSRIMRTWHA